jgi:hypothetical protein
MTSEEALEFSLKVPEAQRNKVQSRTISFMQTLKNNPNSAVWERVRKFPIPADIEEQIRNMSGPKETK